MTTTDTVLLSAARGGDRKAFDQLFGAHVPRLRGVLHRAFGHPGFRFEVAEHVAYCFTCVGRSLDPEQQAALVLRGVLDTTGPICTGAGGSCNAPGSWTRYFFLGGPGGDNNPGALNNCD